MLLRILIMLAVLGSAALAEGVDTNVPVPETKPEKKLTPAEIRQDQLDRLLGSLRANTGLRDPAKTEATIWELWSTSDSKTADIILGQSIRALNDEEPNISAMMLDRLIAAKPDYAEAYNKRASLFFLMRRYDEALKDLDKTLELEPRHFGALSGRGMIYQRQGKNALAIKTFREALAIHPNMKSVADALKLLELSEPGI